MGKSSAEGYKLYCTVLNLFWTKNTSFFCQFPTTSQTLSGLSRDVRFTLDWVQVRALAGPLKAIQRLVPKPLLCFLGCVLSVVVQLEGRPENLVSHGLNLKVPFVKIQVGCHVSFTEEWYPFGHYTIKAWLVDFYRDGPSGMYHVHRGTLALCQTVHRVLGHLPSLLPRLLGLARQAALERVLVVLNFFNLRIMEATVFLGTFNVTDFFCWYPSPGLCLGTILSRRSTDNSFNLMAWFLLWHALSTVGPYMDISVEFTVEFWKSVVYTILFYSILHNSIVSTTHDWGILQCVV